MGSGRAGPATLTRAPRRRESPLLALALTLLACGPEEPILAGVAPPEDAPAAAQEAGPRALPAGAAVDAQALCGHPWDAVRDLASVQLGDIVEVIPLDPRDGSELRLERGRLRVKDGLIYALHVELDRPTRRSAALVHVGLPPQADRWYELHAEFRLRWHSGFERVRMGRLEGDPELVTWVELTRWNPRTQRGR